MVVSIFAQAMSLIAFLSYEIDILLKLKIVSRYIVRGVQHIYIHIYL